MEAAITPPATAPVVAPVAAGADVPAPKAPPADGAAAVSTGAPGGAAASSAETPVASAETPAPADEARPEPTAEEIAAARILRIARDKKALRSEKAGVKDDLALAAVHKALKQAATSDDGDLIAALEASGLDVDRVFNRLTDQIVARAKPAPADPKAVVRKEIEDHEQAKVREINERVKSSWIAQGKAAIDPVAHPTLVRAIAAGRISHDEVFKVAEFEFVHGRASDAASVLAVIESNIAPKARPAPAAPKPTPTPAAAAGNSPVKTVVEDDSKLSIAEVIAKAKAKHGIH